MRCITCTNVVDRRRSDNAVFPGKKLRFQLLRESTIISIVPIIILFIHVSRVHGSDTECESRVSREYARETLLNVVSRVITYSNWILRKITI